MSLFGGRFQGTNIAKMEQLTKNQRSQLPWEGWDLVPEDLASEKFTANAKIPTNIFFEWVGQPPTRLYVFRGLLVNSKIFDSSECTHLQNLI